MKFHLLKLLWAMRAVLYKPLFKKIGLPSYIGRPQFISGMKRITIGKKVRIFPLARIEAMNNGEVIIGNNVYIGQNCHITSSDNRLVIGDGTAVMANVCITNINHIYSNVSKPILEQENVVEQTVIGKDCFIGHNSVIQAGVKLGNHVIVGAGAVVNRGDYCSNCVLAGVPAKMIKRYSNVTEQWVNVNI